MEPAQVGVLVRCAVGALSRASQFLGDVLSREIEIPVMPVPYDVGTEYRERDFVLELVRASQAPVRRGVILRHSLGVHVYIYGYIPRVFVPVVELDRETIRIPLIRKRRTLYPVDVGVSVDRSSGVRHRPVAALQPPLTKSYGVVADGEECYYAVVSGRYQRDSLVISVLAVASHRHHRRQSRRRYAEGRPSKNLTSRHRCGEDRHQCQCYNLSHVVKISFLQY